MDSGEFQAYTEQIEELVLRINGLADEEARLTGLELLQSLLDLHGAVVSRIVEVLSHSGDASRKALAKLGDDPLVCGLLVLYGVHPLPLQDRVLRAMEKVQPQLRKQAAPEVAEVVAEGVPSSSSEFVPLSKHQPAR